MIGIAGSVPTTRSFLAFMFGRTSRLRCGAATCCDSTLDIQCRSRLIAVRRLVGLLLAHSLAVSSAMASSMHVHEYAEHDHLDHHHGPASHEHERSALADQDHHSPPEEDDDHPALEAQSCDPGRHAVAVTLGCVRVPQAQVDLGELPGPTFIAPPAPIRSATPVIEVRVHGPPFDVRIPARAPPLTPRLIT
jgi:hypothetical protein